MSKKMSVIELPRVEVNGRTYVDKENFKKEAIRKRWASPLLPSKTLSNIQ